MHWLGLSSQLIYEQYHTTRSVLSQATKKGKDLAKGKRAPVYFDHQANTFVGLQDVDTQRLKETYKGIDVDKELNKMALWLSSSKGKNRVGSMAFILHWLDNAKPSVIQSSYSTSSNDLSPVQNESFLNPVFLKYLEDLWKNNEHLLALNRMP